MLVVGLFQVMCMGIKKTLWMLNEKIRAFDHFYEDGYVVYLKIEETAIFYCEN
jgi:hypothetical protein